VQGGRFEIRRVLYMAALVASCRNPAIRIFYQSMIDAGKMPKVALVACMRNPDHAQRHGQNQQTLGGHQHAIRFHQSHR
jgi:hypothetical protein